MNEIEECIFAFKSTFKLKFGVVPYVSVRNRGDYRGELSIQELLVISNKALMDAGVNSPDGIMTRRRLNEIVIHRHIFCKIARDLGYTNAQIGRLIRVDRVTVLHSVRTVNNRIETNDRDTIDSLERIYSMIEKFIITRQDTQ